MHADNFDVIGRVVLDLKNLFDIFLNKERDPCQDGKKYFSHSERILSLMCLNDLN